MIEKISDLHLYNMKPLDLKELVAEYYVHFATWYIYVEDIIKSIGN